MSEIRPIMRRAACGEGEGYSIAWVFNPEGTQVRALVDLNQNDGSPEPRLFYLDAPRSAVPLTDQFIRAYATVPQLHSDLSPDESAACHEAERPTIAPRTTLIADTGYALNLSGDGENDLRTYDRRAQTFDPNVEVILEMPTRFASGLRLTGTADLLIGSRAIYNQPSPWQSDKVPIDVPTLSARLDYGGFHLTAGRTPAPGVESIRTDVNPHISHCWIFGFAPFTLTGITLGYGGQAADFNIGAVNGWDNALDNNAHPSLVGSLAVYPHETLSLSFNIIAGPERDNNTDDWRLLSDAAVSWRPSDVFSTTVNFDYGAEQGNGAWASWYGLAGYLNVKPHRALQLVFRPEYFRDGSGMRTGFPASLLGLTAGINVLIEDAFQIRTEYRHDRHFGHETPFNGRDHQNTVGLQLVYTGSWSPL